MHIFKDTFVKFYVLCFLLVVVAVVVVVVFIDNNNNNNLSLACTLIATLSYMDFN